MKLKQMAVLARNFQLDAVPTGKLSTTTTNRTVLSPTPTEPPLKSLAEMPGMSVLEFMYLRWKQPKVYKLQSQIWMREMFDRHGDIWKLAVPGRSFVFVKKSADIQAVFRIHIHCIRIQAGFF